ncbi:hypothetical protein EYC84_007578 [Monilinia fructicola]|uniref:Uncharacterized protein n=1 Tax=Monilinia fructicola TaxID=38448 RepID=A0A5M9JKR4_MONFR|nr:hypothetical protein EYC84_007578 [Monilinia fructicola]
MLTTLSQIGSGDTSLVPELHSSVSSLTLKMQNVYLTLRKRFDGSSSVACAPIIHSSSLHSSYGEDHSRVMVRREVSL